MAQNVLRVPSGYPRIQAAIDAARSGDTVEVAPGTYDESIDFNGKLITVTSTAGPSRTVIDGGLRRSAVVTFKQSETRRAVIKGFTIRGGSGDEGGGITVQSASPSILDNFIVDNTACQGDGIGVSFGSPLIQGNRIAGNRGTCGGLGGGGILVRGASGAEIVDNVIENNIASEGGGISLWAGGAVTVRNNRILNNDGGRQGGGISTVNDAPAIIIQNLIAGNRAGNGGGIHWSNPPRAVINNTIADNEAQRGSALAWSIIRAETIVVNNILTGRGSDPLACGERDDLTGFRANNIFSAGGTPACRVPAAGQNIARDPEFLDVPRLFQLRPSSPSIDAGQSASGLGEFDLAGGARLIGRALDQGAFEFQGTASLSFNPSSLNLGRTAVGLSGPSQAVTIANTGRLPLLMGAITAPAEFELQETCRSAASIAPGGTCAILVAFRPLARGPRSGTLQIVTNAAGSPHSVTLSGEGLAPTVDISSRLITFPQQLAGVPSRAQTVTLTNGGDAPLRITSVAVPPDFEQTNTCAGEVAPRATCAVAIVFTPTSGGRQNGVIRVESNAVDSPHLIPVEGITEAARPAITGVDSAGLTAGATRAEVTILGAGFLRNTRIRWNAAILPATYGSSTVMRAVLDAAALSAAGEIPVTAANEAPGGGESASYLVTVNYPLPVIRQATPASALAGAAGFVVTVSGQSFFPGAAVRWNGDNLNTTFVSRTELRAEVPSSLLLSESVATITVVHPPPGGGESNAVHFAVLTPRPTPTLTSLSPSSVVAGSPALTLRVTGSGFVPASAVQWNRSVRPTAWISETELQATISGADIVAGGTATVNVVNAPPGGGTSGTLIFTIDGNPRPVISQVSPQTLLGGGSAREIRVAGQGFVPGSAVRWNGGDRVTRFVSAAELVGTLDAGDITTPGTFSVTVSSPPPGGGVSNQVSVQVAANNAPVISSVTPSRIPRGAGTIAIAVQGQGFNSSSIIRINGVDQETTLVDPSRVQTTLSAAQTSRPGLFLITVFNPPLGGGESPARAVPVVLTLGTNDLVYDQVRNRLLASIGPTARQHANSLVEIDPESGDVTRSMFAGSSPNRLALASDSSAVFAGLDGAASIVRVDLESGQADRPFSLGSDNSFGSFLAEDIEAMPGAPDTIAVSRYVRGISPRHQGVAIYRAGIALPDKTPGHTGANRIEFSNTGSVLYGYNNETTGFGLYTLNVDDAGVRVGNTAGSLISGFGVDIRYHAGRIYSTTGQVIDADGLLLLGTYVRRGQSSGLSGAAAITPDSALGRTFALYENSLEIFDLNRFITLDAIDFGPSQSALRGPLVRFGNAGLAFRDEQGNVIILPTAAQLARSADVTN